MEKFNKVTGVAAPLPLVNVDTDKIIPKQFLKTIARTGLGKGLFYEMRTNEDGTARDDFILFAVEHQCRNRQAARRFEGNVHQVYEAIHGIRPGVLNDQRIPTQRPQHLYVVGRHNTQILA